MDFEINKQLQELDIALGVLHETPKEKHSAIVDKVVATLKGLAQKDLDSSSVEDVLKRAEWLSEALEDDHPQQKEIDKIRELFLEDISLFSESSGSLSPRSLDSVIIDSPRTPSPKKVQKKISSPLIEDLSNQFAALRGEAFKEMMARSDLSGLLTQTQAMIVEMKRLEKSEGNKQLKGEIGRMVEEGERLETSLKDTEKMNERSRKPQAVAKPRTHVVEPQGAQLLQGDVQIDVRGYLERLRLDLDEWQTTERMSKKSEILGRIVRNLDYLREHKEKIDTESLKGLFRFVGAFSEVLDPIDREQLRVENLQKELKTALRGRGEIVR